MIVRSGDKIALGAEIGHAIEPQMLWGRLVAIRKQPEHEKGRYVLRLYREEDRLGIPTGDYRTTSNPFLVPYKP